MNLRLTRTAVCIALLAALAAVAFGANPPAIQWQRTFTAYRVSHGQWVEPTTDGGYVVAGFTWGSEDTDSTSIAVYMVKTDSQGNREWERTFPGRWHVEARCVQQTADGGYVLTGRGALSCYPERFCNQPFLIKTNSLGELEWCRFYVRDTFEYGFCVRQTPDHGYILTATNPGVDSGLWLIKTDSLGDVKWQRTYGIKHGMPRNNLIVPVELAPDGGYIVGDRTLLKVDSLGNVEWHLTTPRLAMTRSVLVASDGGYVGLGSEFYSWSEWGGSGPMSITLFKTDHGGDLMWSRDIGGQASRGGFSVIQTADGGFVVAATTDAPQGLVIRTDSLGDPVWSRTFGASTGINCIRQTLDGGFIVAGSDWSGGEGMRMSLWKLAPDGQ